MPQAGHLAFVWEAQTAENYFSCLTTDTLFQGFTQPEASCGTASKVEKKPQFSCNLLEGATSAYC